VYAVAVDLLADLLKVAKEGGVLDITVLVCITGHAALAVEVLALKCGLDLAVQDVVPLVEAHHLCADFCTHTGVERGLAGRRDVGGEGGIGELAGQPWRDLWDDEPEPALCVHVFASGLSRQCHGLIDLQHPLGTRFTVEV
jgi:hypothetical protein